MAVVGTPTLAAGGTGRVLGALIVAIDDTRARRAGITNEDVAVSLPTALSGYTAT